MSKKGNTEGNCKNERAGTEESDKNI